MEHQPHVLLVDDQSAITDLLTPILQHNGFRMSVAMDGEEALTQIDALSPDVIVLDVLMPRLDGRSVLRRLRQDNNWTPVILLSQVGSALDRTLALKDGADDYLNKPFEPYELIARIEAVLRRARGSRQPIASATRLRSGALELNRLSERVQLGQEQLTLTPKAVRLLEFLMLHAGERLSRERLLNEVWGWDYPAGMRAVDTRVAELRRALGDEAARPVYIETAPGQGYRFIAPVETTT